MIVTEFFKDRLDGVKLFRTYSDKGLKIRQIETQTEYDEAVDVENSGYTYEEIDTHVESTATEADYINALESLGVDFNG
jgi:hypothetical protein